jgi:hypothetical protein
MPTVKGSADVKRFLAAIPAVLETKVLRGAARAAANVVAEEAKLRSISQAVTNAITVRGRTKDGRIVAKVQVVGKGSYLAPWLEYGTAPHLISVSDKAREGRSVNRINRLAREGSLVIGGQFVGESVQHPGARAHPFLRPALDSQEVEAIAAAQSYINARISRAGITASAEPEGNDA